MEEKGLKLKKLRAKIGFQRGRGVPICVVGGGMNLVSGLRHGLLIVSTRKCLQTTLQHCSPGYTQCVHMDQSCWPEHTNDFVKIRRTSIFWKSRNLPCLGYPLSPCIVRSFVQWVVVIWNDPMSQVSGVKPCDMSVSLHQITCGVERTSDGQGCDWK